MELYENRDAVQGQNRKLGSKNKKTQYAGLIADRDRCHTLAVVCVFLLCVVLLIATTGLWIKYSILSTEKEELLTRYNALILERDQLQSQFKPLQISYQEMALERDSFKERNENLTVTKQKLQNTTAELQSRLTYFEKQEEHKWKISGSSSYYISDMKNWIESKEDCEKRGASLVIINSEEEQKFVNGLVGNRRAWIGLSDIDEEGKWKWLDNTTAPTTTTTTPQSYWRDREPNGKADENCAEIFEPDLYTLKSWNDRKCSEKAIWICEKK